MKQNTFFGKSMKKVILWSVLGLAACTNKPGATKTLQDAGYNNIETTGYSFFGCSEDDLYHTSFKATGPSGRSVSGTVCSGILKNSTIRLD